MMPLTLVRPHLTHFSLDWATALELDSWVATQLLRKLDDFWTQETQK